jgi:hypothetical protein
MMDQKTLDAFEQMWGPFPEPVFLVHKDRTILAANELARAAGVPVGIKCYSLNPQSHGDNCGHCKANIALREGRAVRNRTPTAHDSSATGCRSKVVTMFTCTSELARQPPWAFSHRHLKRRKSR